MGSSRWLFISMRAMWRMVWGGQQNKRQCCSMHYIRPRFVVPRLPISTAVARQENFLLAAATIHEPHLSCARGRAAALLLTDGDLPIKSESVRPQFGS